MTQDGEKFEICIQKGGWLHRMLGFWREGEREDGRMKNTTVGCIKVGTRGREERSGGWISGDKDGGT